MLEDFWTLSEAGNLDAACAWKVLKNPSEEYWDEQWTHEGLNAFWGGMHWIAKNAEDADDKRLAQKVIDSLPERMRHLL
ncbi:MAG: hypothetical protein IPM35_20380 [Myxococcales bacterium]|nr:hypothetical protein [Myxococcales bacterium]